MEENEIGSIVIAEAIKIHRETGPGLFESVYETILAHQLQRAGLDVDRQLGIPISYADMVFDVGFRADLIIESKVIVELKSVDQVSRAHRMQVLTYLRLSGMHLGYLLNFNVDLMKNGIHRIVDGLPQ